jgi:pimeloyl-ACP methyl ester carboxylesterase
LAHGNVIGILLGAVTLATALVCATLAYRAFRQHLNARAFAIPTGNGIDEALFVRIGGIEQWVQIRSEDRANPVVFVLHGGMALSYMALTPLFQPWEKHFTVVQWDRRGVGKTFGRNRRAGHGEMTLERIVLDGIELSEWLRKRLQKEKLILLGHSMGSIVGVAMASRRPDLFEAYLGTEQVVTMRQNEAKSYQLILAKLRAAGDERNARVLERIGPPPYANARAWGRKQQQVGKVDAAYRRAARRTIPSMLLLSPKYSLKDLFDFVAGNQFSGEHLFVDWMAFDATKLGYRFEVPVLIIQGGDDVMAPTALVEEWFALIEAPKKEFVAIESCGHLMMFTRPSHFLEKLIALLLLMKVTKS